MNAVAVGPKPAQVTCPSCRAVIITRIDRKSTSKTHLVALCLCLCLCWPCVCVPYCLDSCRNADHYCPNCNAFLGQFRILSVCPVDPSRQKCPIYLHCKPFCSPNFVTSRLDFKQEWCFCSCLKTGCDILTKTCVPSTNICIE